MIYKNALKLLPSRKQGQVLLMRGLAGIFPWLNAKIKKAKTL